MTRRAAPAALLASPLVSLLAALLAALLLAGCGPVAVTAPPVSPQPEQPGTSADDVAGLEALVTGTADLLADLDADLARDR